MKTLEFIYQETQIHFALQNEGNVMVNATEMAKLFNKRTDHFLQNESTKQFIQELKVPEMSGILESKRLLNRGCLDHKIIDNRGRNGIYFERRLALKFAAWLDVKFEVWVFSTLDEILFGNYKQHWEAHIIQVSAEKEMERLKNEMFVSPTPEIVKAYFDASDTVKNCKNIKLKAIKNQYKLEL